MTGPHDAALHRLTYLSSARIDMSREGLDAILEVARENNRRRHITGLLIYHDLQFLQTLEGAREQLEQTFAAIRTDRRHSGCLVLELRPAEGRIFDDWAMAYKSSGALSTAQKSGLLDLTKVRAHYGEREVNGNPDTRILIDNFLSSFRDLDLH